jgi:hypothetical protein
VFLDGNAFPNLTLDGQYFVVAGNYFTNTLNNFVYSPTYNTIVSGNYTSIDQGITWIKNDQFNSPTYNIVSNDKIFKIISSDGEIKTYTSTDGLAWKYEGVSNVNFTIDPHLQEVFWSQEKGYFIAQGKYISRDGINWTLVGNQEVNVTLYADTLGMFMGYTGDVVNDFTHGQNYYSYDGYMWNLTNESDLYLMAWSSPLKIFVGVKELSNGFCGFFVSTDGINWEQTFTTTLYGRYPRGIAWSTELEKFFVYDPGNYYSSNPVQYYDQIAESSDGYNWVSKQLTTTSQSNSIFQQQFYWISGLNRFVIIHDELVSVRVLFSQKAIEQF